jgi:hypothetical protein
VTPLKYPRACNELVAKGIPRPLGQPCFIEPIEVDSDSSSITVSPAALDAELEELEVTKKLVQPQVLQKQLRAQPKVMKDKAYEVFCGAAGLTTPLSAQLFVAFVSLAIAKAKASFMFWPPVAPDSV